MLTNCKPSLDLARQHRVLAWWDMNLQIGSFHKRKVTARPLKALERTLGHRLHVEGWHRYENMPDGEWQFEAYHYLATADTALAAYSMLKQLSPLSPWLGMSWPGFNTAATALTDNPDESTICAFYWSNLGRAGMPCYESGGVLLRLVSSDFEALDRRDRSQLLARSVVWPALTPEQPADYNIEFTVHIICGNRQDLMSYHWPRFQGARWPSGVDDLEVDARTHAGKPNIIRVRQTLRGFREHEAIAYCLSHAPGFRIKLDEGGSEFSFVGERPPSQNGTDGIVAFSMTKTN